MATGSLIPNGKVQFTTNIGTPLVGGRVYFYVPGTTTLKNTYQDSALTILNTNPVVLDARGEAIIWGSGAYRQVVVNAFGATVWDVVTQTNDVDIDDVLAVLSSTSTGEGDSLVKHVFNTTLGDSITVNDYIGNFLPLETFYLSATDNGDYGPALTRASGYSSVNGVPIRIDKMYQIKTAPTIYSGTTLIGLGRFTGLYCPADAPVNMLYASGQSNILIQNMLLNGGITSATTSKNSTRGVRWISCTNVVMRDIWATACADWAISFETCDGVTLQNYIYFGGGLNLPGGRDGAHLLNCRNAFFDNFDIASGDDCVGVTVQGTYASYNITISNIRGNSDIASVVTIGFETGTTGTFDNIKIDNVCVKTSGSARYIVQCRGVAADSILNASISRVFGTSSLYGCYLQNIKRLVISDINVVSSTQHGLYGNACTNVTGHDLVGTASASGFDGINFTGCTGRVLLDNPQSDAGPTYCAQFNGCGTVIVRNANLTNGATASVRFVNNTWVSFHGIATNTVGTYGINQSGNAYIRQDTGSQVTGVTSAYNTIPYQGVTDEGYAYGDITQSSATTIAAASVYTNTITPTASATGQVDFVFARPMRAARYVVEVQPYGSTNVRARVASKTVNGFSIITDDFTGTAVNASYSFIVYNAGSTNV